MLNLGKIKQDPDCKYAYELVRHIDRHMIGRVCLDECIHYLWVIGKQVSEDVGRFTYLEIGTLFGGTLCLMSKPWFTCATLGVDTFEYYGKKQDPDTGLDMNMGVVEDNLNSLVPYRNCRCQEGSTDIYCGDSHDAETKEYVWVNTLDNIGVLLIDGDHSCDGVVQDFEDYGELVRPGGVIVFHDYLNPAWPGVGEAVSTIIESLDDEWYIVGQLGTLFILQRDVKI